MARQFMLAFVQVFKIHCLWVLIGCLLFSNGIFAADKILDVSSFNETPISLTEYFAVFEDSDAKLTLKDIQSPDIANRFAPTQSTDEALNYGITSSAYWLRLTLRNPTNFPKERMLEISDARISNITFFQLDTKKNYQAVVTGMNFPFSTRAYKNRYFVFPLTLPANSEQTFYLQIASVYSMIIPAKLWSPDSFHLHERNDYFFQIWYFGIATAMIIFNLLLFMMLRDAIYLLYVIYATLFSFYTAAMNGLGREFLWSNLSLNPDISSSEFFYIAIVALLLFMRQMLDTKKIIPIGDFLIKVCIGIYLFQFVICPISYQIVIHPKINYLHLSLAFFTLSVGVLCASKRQRSAYFFLTAFFMFFLGGLLMSLRTLHILPTNIFTMYGFQFGSAWEMLFLAFALADRFNTIRKDKERVQAELVENLRKSEQILETRVSQRTLELQHLNNALNQRERYQRALLDNFPFMVWLKDTKSRFLAVNQILAKNFGEDNPDNMLGKTDFEYSPKEMAESYQHDDQLVLVTQKQKTLEEKITNHAGETFWFETFKAPVFDDNGNALGTVGFARDISIRKQVEEAAKELEKAKANFFANMSHEIRTPMNGIIGLSQLALKQKLSVEVRNYLEKIYKSSNNLLSILNDILDFSKLEANGFIVDEMPFNLDSILDDVANLFEHDTEGKALAFKINIAQDVPRDLIGDFVKLRQVLINLISNAKKFTQEGDVVVSIDVKKRLNDKIELCFSVSDTGIGMTAEQLEKLFTPFSQMDTSITRKYGGTGLGLSICKQFVELMKGELRVDSVYGKGSCFSFDLLLHIDAQPIYARTSTTIHSTPAQYESKRILLVEDNEINRLVAEELLISMGLQIQVAHNGKEAVECALVHSFDLILMDIQMPIMDGLQATKLMRTEPTLQNIPIVAMTAHAMESDIQKSLAAGMNDHLTKPIEIEKLVAVLNNWLKIDHAQPFHCLSVLEKETNLLPESLPPFDLGQALIFCNYNQTLLYELLLSFHHRYAEAADRLKSFVRENDFLQVKHLVHSIKGVAGTLGANDLRNAALAFETMSQSGQIKSISVLLNDLIEKLNTAVVAAGTLPPLEQKPLIAQSNLNTDDVEQLLIQLKQALSTNNLKAIDIFTELKPYLLQYNLQPIAEELTHWMDMLDFSRAFATLERININS